MATATKMTQSTLTAYCKTVLDAAKVADPNWTPTKESIMKLLEKVGRQVLVNQTYTDRLAFMDGEDILFGAQAIEESFIGLSMVKNKGTLDEMAELENKIYTAPVHEPYYSTSSGKKYIPTFVPNNEVEKVCLGPDEAANFLATMILRLNQAQTMYRYNFKKGLIGKIADRAIDSNQAGLVTTAVKPDATKATKVEDALAFIAKVKNAVEIGDDSNSCCLSGELIGAAPAYKLFIKNGIKSILDETNAGAFNPESLGLKNVEIISVADFGEMTHDNVFAVLVDERMIRVHQGYNEIRSKELIYADGWQYVKHFEDVGYASCFTYLQVFAEEQA